MNSLSSNNKRKTSYRVNPNAVNLQLCNVKIQIGLVLDQSRRKKVDCVLCFQSEVQLFIKDLSEQRPHNNQEEQKQEEGKYNWIDVSISPFNTL